MLYWPSVIIIKLRKMYMEEVGRYFLLLLKPEVVFFFLIVGYLFIDQQVFRRTIILLLFTCIISKLLKSFWKVPLNPIIGEGWAYPSGHTLFNVVLWLTLLYQLPKKWVVIKLWLLLPLGLYFMEAAGYHDWPEIFGGICAGVIVSSIYIHWLMWRDKNELHYRIFMPIMSFAIYIFLSLNYDFDFSWMLKLLGFMVVVCLLDAKHDAVIKGISAKKKILIVILTILSGVLLKEYVKSNEFKLILNFTHGLLLASLALFALPNLMVKAQK